MADGARRLSLRRWAGLAAFGSVLRNSVLALTLISWPALLTWVVVGQHPAWVPAAVVGGVTLVTFVISRVVARVASRAQPGAVGRTRLQISALVQTFAPLALVPVGILAYGAYRSVEASYAFTYTLDEAQFSLPNIWQTALFWSAAVAILILVADLFLTIGFWFLLPLLFRKLFWWVFDALLLGLFVYVTIEFPYRPVAEGAENLVLPLIRLAVTTIFAMRLLARLLGPTMKLIERSAFEGLVASRHLRSKKSGFLATISSLSIGAVAVSTCMLVAVLSVMGGFRNDLKEKIMGSHAHVLVDHEDGNFEGWGPVVEAASRADGVLAATPYVQAEVMITSASAREGVLLRGIDPETVGEATDLVSNLTRGRMEYLSDPSLLLNLPPEERDSILPMDMLNGGLVDDIDQILQDRAVEEDETGAEPASEQTESAEQDEMEPEDSTDTPDGLHPPRAPLAPIRDIEMGTQRDEPVLPGIILGRELARTLRVFLGDQVDVVSPFGDLGPTGPMPKTRRFRVAGVFYSGMYEYDMKATYVLLPRAQAFLGTGDAITGVELKIEDVEQAERVALSVTDELNAAGRRDLRARGWQETNSGLFGALELEKLAMFITLGIAILIAGFCVFGTLTLMVQEKSREVGILLAMGTRPRAIASIFMFEGFLIGLYGALLGLGAGYVIVFVFEYLGIRIDPEVYYIDRVPVHIDGIEFLTVFVVAVFMCVLATIFPSMLASRMRPVDAIRFQ